MVAATVELGDWREVLPGTYDPELAVVITDPPFGLDSPAHRAVSHHTREPDRGYSDAIPWADHVREVLELLPALRHVIRGPASALVRRDHPQPRRLCVEVSLFRRRSTHRPGMVPYMWHGWAVYGNLRVGYQPRAARGDAVLIRPYADDASSSGDHRGVTPYEAAMWAVETWAAPGLTVLDPFAGTARIGRAALELEQDYRGAELDARWWREAQRTLGHRAQRLGLDELAPPWDSTGFVRRS
jgi:hypothetical protein